MSSAAPTRRYLLVQAGAERLALPLERVRRVVRDLQVIVLPGAAPELKGLAEFGGEPMPVIDLTRLVGAAPGANPPYPSVVVSWAGPEGSRELVGLAVDAALEVVDLAADAVVPGGGGVIRGDASIHDHPVRILSLAALGQP